MRVELRLAGGDAAGRGVSERIEHLPTRRSFEVFVNLVWYGRDGLGGRTLSREGLGLAA